MKIIRFIVQSCLVTLVSFFLIGCAGKSGFIVKTVVESSGSDFESISYIQHCYYKSIDLGNCQYLDVSPNGQKALIQDSITGAVSVFHTNPLNKEGLTDVNIGRIEKIVWFDLENKVQVFIKGKPYDFATK